MSIDTHPGFWVPWQDDPVDEKTPDFYDDVTLTPVALPEPKCECGAKALGAKDWDLAHSRWCPVALL